MFYNVSFTSIASPFKKKIFLGGRLFWKYEGERKKHCFTLHWIPFNFYVKANYQNMLTVTCHAQGDNLNCRHHSLKTQQCSGVVQYSAVLSSVQWHSVYHRQITVIMSKDIYKVETPASCQIASTKSTIVHLGSDHYDVSDNSAIDMS